MQLVDIQFTPDGISASAYKAGNHLHDEAWFTWDEVEELKSDEESHITFADTEGVQVNRDVLRTFMEWCYHDPAIDSAPDEVQAAERALREAVGIAGGEGDVFSDPGGVFQVYEFQRDGTKCGYCNWQTQDHYVLAKSRESAQELIDDPPEGVGFCASCLIREVLADHHVVATPG